eukprot:gene14571-31007_t
MRVSYLLFVAVALSGIVCSDSSTTTAMPSQFPSTLPSRVPTASPSVKPSLSPTRWPTTASPTFKPSFKPSSPSTNPSRAPSYAPSVQPSFLPSSLPTLFPTNAPSTSPSTRKPTIRPSVAPSSPSVKPTRAPSAPSSKPSLRPSAPSVKPSKSPTSFPSTGSPTSQPTYSAILWYRLECMLFDGSSNFLHTPSLSEDVSDAMTISLWINTTVSNTSSLVSLGRGRGNTTNGQFMLYIDNSGRLGFWDYDHGHYYCYNVTGNTVVTTGRRTHVSFVRSETTGTFYVNGKIDGVMSCGRRAIGNHLNSNYHWGSGSDSNSNNNNDGNWNGGSDNGGSESANSQNKNHKRWGGKRGVGKSMARTNGIFCQYSSTDLILGKDYRLNKHFFHGNMDHAEVHFGTSTPSQIMNIYKTGLPYTEVNPMCVQSTDFHSIWSSSGCMSFDGSSSFYQTPSLSEDVSDAMTISLWINTT